jgi:hypothetical protein
MYLLPAKGCPLEGIEKDLLQPTQPNELVNNKNKKANWRVSTLPHEAVNRLR